MFFALIVVKQPLLAFSFRSPIGSQRDVYDDRCMIRWLLAFPGVAVDEGEGHAIRQHPGREHEIDPHAAAGVKARAARSATTGSINTK